MTNSIVSLSGLVIYFNIADFKWSFIIMIATNHWLCIKDLTQHIIYFIHLIFTTAWPSKMRKQDHREVRNVPKVTSYNNDRSGISNFKARAPTRKDYTLHRMTFINDLYQRADVEKYVHPACVLSCELPFPTEQLRVCVLQLVFRIVVNFKSIQRVPALCVQCRHARSKTPDWCPDWGHPAAQ